MTCHACGSPMFYLTEWGLYWWQCRCGLRVMPIPGQQRVPGQ
jgi:hypothetical protein